MLIHKGISRGIDRKEWALHASLSMIDKNQIQYRLLIKYNIGCYAYLSGFRCYTGEVTVCYLKAL